MTRALLEWINNNPILTYLIGWNVAFSFSQLMWSQAAQKRLDDLERRMRNL